MTATPMTAVPMTAADTIAASTTAAPLATPSSASAQLAAWAHQPFTTADRSAAWATLFDTLSVGVGAHAHEAQAIQSISALLCAGQPRGEVIVPGLVQGLPAPQAAAMLALACHSIDCDDTYMENGVKTHISAIVVPAALAVAQAQDAPLEQMLDAICAGIEVEARLGHRVTPAMVQRWHPTGTLGPVGAAAAACRVLNLSVERTEQALGLAADAGAGTRVCLDQGDASKSLHAAYAARHGVEAALLVHAGARGPVGFFEARNGYFDSYVAAQVRDAADPLAWGPSGARVHHNSLKLYPAMHALHAAIAALIDLKRGVEAAMSAPESIVISQSTTHAKFGRASDPQTPLGARLSLAYCAAVSWLDGACGFAQFTPQRLHEPGLRALMARVQVHASAELERDYPDRIASHVAVTLADGRLLQAFVADPAGCPLNPAPPERLIDKMTELLLGVVSPVALTAWLAEFSQRRTRSAREFAALMPQPRTVANV